MKRILREFQLDKIAAVDHPCQEHAVVTIMKRAQQPKDLTKFAPQFADLQKRMDALADKAKALPKGKHHASPLSHSQFEKAKDARGHGSEARGFGQGAWGPGNPGYSRSTDKGNYHLKPPALAASGTQDVHTLNFTDTAGKSQTVGTFAHTWEAFPAARAHYNGLKKAKDARGHGSDTRGGGKTKLTPARQIASYAVIIRAIHERGATQQEALKELGRRGLWLNDEQKVSAGLKKAKDARGHGSEKHSGKTVPDQHQHRILVDNVRNPLKGKFLGGPSAEESESILRSKFGYKDQHIAALKKHAVADQIGSIMSRVQKLKAQVAELASV